MWEQGHVFVGCGVCGHGIEMSVDECHRLAMWLRGDVLGHGVVCVQGYTGVGDM